MCLGVSVQPGDVNRGIITTITLQRAGGLKRLWYWLRQLPGCPRRGVSSLQANKNATFHEHRDSNNVGPSWIAGIGNFTAGEIFIRDADPPKKHDIKDKLVEFDGSNRHWTLPFTGTRYSLTAFHHKGADSMEATKLTTLQDVGFPWLDTSRPETPSPPLG